MNKKQLLAFCMLSVSVISFEACKKDDDKPVVDPCASKTITATTVVTNADGCSTVTGGTVTVTGAGSTKFTYNVDGGTFQASGRFTDVKAGKHTFIAKDSLGCSKSVEAEVVAATAGAKFLAVKAIMVSSCVKCHGSPGTTPPNLAVDCNIVISGPRVKARAVDVKDMPKGGPVLSVADQEKITSWLTAGGRFVD